MGWTVLYIAFGIVALWLLGEVLLQYKARLRWRLLAFVGFLGVVVGVLLPSVVVIGIGAIAFAIGQTYVTLSFRRGFSTGWALGGSPGASRRRKAGGEQGAPPEPTLEVSGPRSRVRAGPAQAGPRTREPGAAVYQPEPMPDDTGQYGVYSDAAYAGSQQARAAQTRTPAPTTTATYARYGTGYGQRVRTFAGQDVTPGRTCTRGSTTTAGAAAVRGLHRPVRQGADQRRPAATSPYDSYGGLRQLRHRRSTPPTRTARSSRAVRRHPARAGCGCRSSATATTQPAQPDSRRTRTSRPTHGYNEQLRLLTATDPAARRTGLTRHTAPDGPAPVRTGPGAPLTVSRASPRPRRSVRPPARPTSRRARARRPGGTSRPPGRGPAAGCGWPDADTAPPAPASAGRRHRAARRAPVSAVVRRACGPRARGAARADPVSLPRRPRSAAPRTARQRLVRPVDRIRAPRRPSPQGDRLVRRRRGGCAGRRAAARSPSAARAGPPAEHGRSALRLAVRGVHHGPVHALRRAAPRAAPAAP